jgi:hypothetical protein
VLLVRYEDIGLQPYDTLKKCLQYLQLDYNDKIIQEMISRTKEAMEHRTTASFKKSIGRWRTELSDKEKQQFKDILGSVMEEFGYPVQE